MKKIILITVIALWASITNAQWNIIHTQPAQFLKSLYFINQDTGYVIDGYGAIIKV